jgi:hypothetical protein
MPTTVLYTTIEAIRSTIGIDEDDVSDQMILDQKLHFQMLERLEEFLPTHEDVFDGSEAGERRLTLWCQYFGALQLLDNSILAIPQKIQANTDQMSRFQVDWEALKDGLRRKLYKLENTLVVPTTGSFAIMGASIPAYDPVTG